MGTAVMTERITCGRVHPDPLHDLARWCRLSLSLYGQQPPTRTGPVPRGVVGVIDSMTMSAPTPE